MSSKDWLRFWAAGLIWGTSFLWIKIAVTEINPFILVGFRTLFGALGLLGIIIFFKSKGFTWKNLRPWLGIFTVVGLLNIALPWLLISWSEQYIASGIASILNSTVPLFTIILAAFLLKEDRLTVSKMVGLLIGFAGVVLLFIQELSVGFTQDLLGLGAMLLGALCYALASIYIKRKAKGLPSEIQAFLQLATASLMIWAFTLVALRPIQMPHLTITWLALLWLGLLGSSLAYIFYFGLIHSVGPTRASMVTYVPPMVGLILGAIFLKEHLGWQAWVGGMMIIAGITVANMKKLPLKSTAFRNN